MNDKIINQISELMQVSYDKAVELYPIVKTQFLWYEFLGGIETILTWVLVLELIFCMGSFSFEYGYKGAKYKKNIKISALTIFITTLVIIAVFGAKLILAPDIVFVKGLLGGK